MSRWRPNPMRDLARDAFLQAAQLHLPAGTRLGKLGFLGEGLHRKTWRGLLRTPAGDPVEWVAQVPRPDSDAEDRDRFRAEVELLGALERRALPFRVPRVVDRIRVGRVEVNITTLVYGGQVDMRGRMLQPAVSAGVIASVAAQVHAIDPTGLPLPAQRHATALADAESSIDDLRDLDAPFVDDLIDWCEAHRPDADAPAVLLHGDLLGQNVLYTLDGPAGLIDWELAGTGDPASDLAVVTRGARRVFGVEHGTSLLLEAYAEHAERPVSPASLRLYELALVANEVTAFYERYPDGGPSRMNGLRNLLDRPLAE